MVFQKVILSLDSLSNVDPAVLYCVHNYFHILLKPAIKSYCFTYLLLLKYLQLCSSYCVLIFAPVC